MGLGRPVLTPDYIQAHTVGIAGQKDVIWDPLWDSLNYPSAGAVLFTFFAVPKGQGNSVAPLNSGQPKGIWDTNIVNNNQLPANQEFYAIGSETIFTPGLAAGTNQATSYQIEPGRAATAATVGAFTNDIFQVGEGGFKQLTVNTDRAYVQDGPLKIFPPATRLGGWAAVTSGGTATSTAFPQVDWASWQGEPYTLVPLWIQSNMQFQLTIQFPAAIPTFSGFTGRLIERIRGYFIRQPT